MPNRFEEIQYFRQPWLWILLLGLQLFLLWGLFKQIVLGEPFGSNPAPNGLLILIAFIPLSLIVLFALMHLKTTISHQTIEILFYPFSKVIINKEEIEHAEIRKYKALTEYGGWGIRFGNGKAYTISGNQGLQLQLKDGRKTLVGTQKPTELQSAINDFLSAK